MKNSATSAAAIDILLIHSPMDSKFQDISVVYSPPLAQLSIQGYLEHHGIKERIKILDGSVVSQQEIIRTIETAKPRIVGFGVLLLSYENTLEAAATAKKHNATVIFGGHQASHLSEEIITNRKDIVDVVIVGNGEIPFLKLCQGIPYKDIEGITYFDKEKNCIVRNVSNLKTFLDDISYYAKVDFDYSVYQDKYVNNHLAISSNKYRRTVSHKGCGYRYKSRCEFCGRYDDKVSHISPAKFWELFNDYGLEDGDFVFDIGDDFLFHKKWLKEALVQKKLLFDKKVKLGVFGRIDKVDDSIDLIKELGVYDITVGFESGDEEVFKSANKGITDTGYYLEKTEFLLENGIYVTPSYVLGLEGETEKSLVNTLKQAERVKALTEKIMGTPPHEIVANLIEPVPGSPAFLRLLKAFPEKYVGQDLLDLVEMQKDYFSIIHNLKNDKEYDAFRTMLKNYGKEINQLVGFCDTEGWLKDEVL